MYMMLADMFRMYSPTHSRERIRKARSSSRWDTPSPTAELSSDSTPTLGPTLSVGRGRGHGRGWSTGETLAVGRGRGKKVKKNKKVKKW